MHACVHLGGRLLVVRDGVELSAPPSRSTVCLLLGLVVDPMEWHSRGELAAKLYPEAEPAQGRVALRKTLSRLRAWLGEDGFEQRSDLVRLGEGWTYDLALPDGGRARRSAIAPGLSHPWVDELRERLIPRARDENDEGLANLFQAIAKQDRVVGRGMLLGAGSCLWNMDAVSIESLLRLTRPDGPGDRFVAEYLQFKGLYEHASGRMGSSLRSLSRAYRLALEQEQLLDSRRAAALILFGLIEAGDYNRASKWMDRAARNRADPICTMAVAAEAWNRNQFAEAREIMAVLEASIDDAERTQQVHYWYNRAVLAAESGHLDEYHEAYERCRSHLSSDDFFWTRSLELATYWAMIHRKEHEKAVIGLESLGNYLRDNGWNLNQIYALETQALALAIMGQRSRAVGRWRESENLRKAGQIGLNDRRRAIKSKIMALL